MWLHLFPGYQFLYSPFSSPQYKHSGKIAGEINSLNLEEKVDGLARAALQEKIVSQLDILLRVYRDTTESLTLPEVNLQEVAAN